MREGSGLCQLKNPSSEVESYSHRFHVTVLLCQRVGGLGAEARDPIEELATASSSTEATEHRISHFKALGLSHFKALGLQPLQSMTAWISGCGLTV